MTAGLEHGAFLGPEFTNGAHPTACLVVCLSVQFPSSPSLFLRLSHLLADPSRPSTCCLFTSSLASLKPDCGQDDDDVRFPLDEGIHDPEFFPPFPASCSFLPLDLCLHESPLHPSSAHQPPSHSGLTCCLSSSTPSSSHLPQTPPPPATVSASSTAGADTSAPQASSLLSSPESGHLPAGLPSLPPSVSIPVSQRLSPAVPPHSETPAGTAAKASCCQLGNR